MTGRLFAAAVLLAAGWLLGWYSHSYLGQGPDRPVTAPPQHPLAESPPYVVMPAADVTPSDALAGRLAAGDFEDAVGQYEALQRQGDEGGARQARAMLLEHARALMDRRDSAAAEALLQRLLVADWRDVETRVLLAGLSQARGETGAALDWLYAARGHAGDAQVHARLTGRIRTLVAAESGALQAAGDDAGLLGLYRQLTQLEPEYAPYFIGLAEAQLALGDTAAALQSLQLVAQDPDHGAQAVAMLARLLPVAQGQAEESSAAVAGIAGIPLRRRGNHFLVEAQPGSGDSLELLIDTGASVTILTPAALAHHRVAYRDTGRQALFSTANGRVQAPVYRIDALTVGDWEVRGLEIGVLELGSGGAIDGLLGMDFLQHFRFFIDQNRAELRLSLREP
jgi:clan AA aspartic protease (TIGR02281 family)